jgi:hypothetical protein
MNKNFGFIKASLASMIAQSYINESNIDQTKKLYWDYLSTIKNSPILALEFVIYKNIENKCSKNDSAIIKYIDENISLLKKYDFKSIVQENKKLDRFFVDSTIDPIKSKLYESIESIIFENTKRIPNIDLIHESIEHIIEYIKSNKKVLDLNESTEESNDDVIKIAVKIYSDKYSNLDETERKIMKVMVSENETEKIDMFEQIKNQTVEYLESIKEKNPDSLELINECITNIQATEYNQSTVIDEIVKIQSLKEVIGVVE